MFLMSALTDDAAWEAFRRGSEGGGTPPDWTRYPTHHRNEQWWNALDCAGWLWRRGASDEPSLHGDSARVVPALNVASGVFSYRRPAAVYQSGSSGAAVVVWAEDGHSPIVGVLRAEPKLGTRERLVMGFLRRGPTYMIGSSVVAGWQSATASRDLEYIEVASVCSGQGEESHEEIGPVVSSGGYWWWCA